MKERIYLRYIALSVNKRFVWSVNNDCSKFIDVASHIPGQKTLTLNHNRQNQA
jgi:hypothetical protein